MLEHGVQRGVAPGKRDRERRTTITDGRIPFVEDDELRGVDPVDRPGATTFGLTVTDVVAHPHLLVS